MIIAADGSPVSTVSLAVAPTSLPQGSVGSAYSATLAATGGTPFYTWRLTTGQLPAGLHLTTAGVLSGTPTSSGNSTFGVTVVDSGSPAQTATAIFKCVCDYVCVYAASYFHAAAYFYTTGYTTGYACIAGYTCTNDPRGWLFPSFFWYERLGVFKFVAGERRHCSLSMGRRGGISGGFESKRSRHSLGGRQR